MGARGEWLPLLELERHRVAGDSPDVVMVHGAAVPEEAPGWKMQRLAA